MSEVAGYNKVQLSTFISGDQFVFRADDGPGLEETVKSVAGSADGTIEALNALKQAGVANGIMTGDSSKKGATPSSDRKPDQAPPSGNSEAPTCLHGPMTDLSHKNYKKRWYCPEKGKDRQCWAKD